MKHETKGEVEDETPRSPNEYASLFFLWQCFFSSFVRFPNYIHADWYECDNEQIWVRIFLCGSSNANEAPCGLSEFAWVFKNRLDEGRKKDSIVDLKLFCWEFQCRGYWDLNHFNEELDVSIGEPYHRSIKYIVIWNEERKRESTQIYQMQNDAGRKKLSFTIYVCIDKCRIEIQMWMQIPRNGLWLWLCRTSFDLQSCPNKIKNTPHSRSKKLCGLTRKKRWLCRCR